MEYASARRWLPRLGGLYILAGLLATAAPGFEVFPIFCWFLFPVVPGYEPRYELIAHELSGEAIEPPRSYQSLGLVKDPMAMDLWLATQRLGHAVETKDKRRTARIRQLIEESFLCAPSRYAIDRVAFDPVERFRTGRVRQRQTVAVFTSSSGCQTIPWASP